MGGQGLGQDAQRDLGRRLGAQVEADRHPHAQQGVLGHAVLAQQVQDRRPAPGAAQEPDIAHRRAQRVAQHREIVLVVVRHQHQRGGRDERDLLHQLGGHADPEIVHVREALLGGEARPAVHHDGAEAERLGQRGERHRHVAGPHHDEGGGRREDLREGAHVLEEQRPRLARGHGLAGLRREALVEEGVAEGPLLPAVVEEQELGAMVWRIEAGHDHGPPALLGVDARPLVVDQRGVVGVVERHRLQENLDGAAAGEPDLPGLLIAQIQLEKPRGVLVEHVGRLLDDLGVHAAADGHRAEHTPALAHQHLRPFLPGRGTARIDEGGHRHLGLVPLELVQVLVELGHVGYLRLRWPARSRRLARLCAAAKWSMSGSAAAMPRVRGS